MGDPGTSSDIVTPELYSLPIRELEAVLATNFSTGQTARSRTWTPPTNPSANPGNRSGRRKAAAATKTRKLDKVEATRRLHEAIADIARESQSWVDGGRQGVPPALAIKGEAGLGKSVSVLDALALPAWKHRRVLYLVPTLDLGEELAAKAIERGIDARVIRGRSQPAPGERKNGGAKMCAKSDLAESLAALSIDVTNTLCRSRTKGGAEEHCEFAATCPYLRQMQDQRAGLLIAAHQYIPLSVEGLKAENIDLVILDESFWQSLTRQSFVDIARFRVARQVGDKGYGRRKDERLEDWQRRCADANADFDAVLSKATRVFEIADRPLTLDDFRAVGLTVEECQFARGVEYSRLGKPEITAGMPYAVQLDIVKKARVDEAFGFARIWAILERELAQPRQQLIGLERDNEHFDAKAKAFRVGLHTYWSPEAKLAEVPVVILDADVDKDIAARFYPACDRVIEISSTWSACHVTQVVDRPVSANMLAGKNPRADEQQRHGNRREDLWWMAHDMAERHGHPLAYSPDAAIGADARARRPLLVTYKGVEDAWVEDKRIEADDAVDRPLRNALPFDVAHLGDLRGRDAWKAATGVIVAGRLEPRVDAIEQLARCVYYSDPREFVWVVPDDKGRRLYPKVPRDIELADGAAIEVDVAAHPDPRCDAILRQVRESELTQAIARVRPVHRNAADPCEVIVATNIPLPGVIVDRVVEWSDLVPDRMRRMKLAGVAPDLSADAAAAWPELFPSAGAVRKARSRAAAAAGNHVEAQSLETCDKAHLVSTIGDGTGSEQYVRVEYVRRGSGGNRRRGSSLVRVSPSEGPTEAKARLLAKLPDAEEIRVVGPIPSPAQDPERHAIMLESALLWLEDFMDADDLMVGPRPAAGDSRDPARSSPLGAEAVPW